MQVIRNMAYAYGRRNRAAKARVVGQLIAEMDAKSLLFIGVASGGDGVNNLIERSLLDACPTVVASGLHLEDPSWPTYIQADVLDLPFENRQFDVVVANAVIEHVGGEQKQRRMMAEIGRVGQSWMVTTPNRWFPIEAHHHSLFSHYRRAWCPKNGVTRLLGIRDLDGLLPDGRVVGWPVVSPTLTAVHRG